MINYAIVLIPIVFSYHIADPLTEPLRSRLSHSNYQGQVDLRGTDPQLIWSWSRIPETERADSLTWIRRIINPGLIPTNLEASIAGYRTPKMDYVYYHFGNAEFPIVQASESRSEIWITMRLRDTLQIDNHALATNEVVKIAKKVVNFRQQDIQQVQAKIRSSRGNGQNQIVVGTVGPFVNPLESEEQAWYQTAYIYTDGTSLAMMIPKILPGKGKSSGAGGPCGPPPPYIPRFGNP